MKLVAPALVALLAVGLARPARADVPPPPGYIRVGYSFQLSAPVEGRAIVAFPTYTSAGAVAEVMEAGEAYRSWQGYSPGLYSLTRADADALPKTDEAVKTLLAERGVQCIKATPRIFQVPIKNGFTEVRDVFRITMNEGKCRTELVSTTYEGNGKKAEGGVLSNGTRNVPPPFAAFEVQPIGDIGLDLTGAPKASDAPPPVSPADPPSSDPSRPVAPAEPPTTHEPPSAGCAGCSDGGRSPSGGGWALGGLLALAAALQRRRARSRAAGGRVDFSGAWPAPPPRRR
ncbi:MAG: hypothetical protein WKG00_14210 [Polyangiaceae bacterium]